MYNPNNQCGQPRNLREIVIVPGFSEINRTKVRALARNYSSKNIEVDVGRLTCEIEMERPGSEYSVLEPSDPEANWTNDEEWDSAPCKKIIYNLPRRVRKRMIEEECELKTMLDKADTPSEGEVKSIKIPEGERTLEEKRSLLEQVYPDDEDKADFSQQPGEELGFDFSPPRSVWDQYDFGTVSPQYRPFVRKLIHEHEELFSTLDLDCGDISVTLGTYSLPLKKPLPHSSHRIYFMQGRKEQSLKIILSLMLRHGLIRRVKSASFSSPVFLIEKKDKASLPRLLADVRQLNEHLCPVH